MFGSCLVRVWFCLVCFVVNAHVCTLVQDPRVLYVVTGFVECSNHHFVAYVKQKTGWFKCDDSVVTRLEAGVGTIWPRLIFMEKMRRQRCSAPEVPEATAGTFLHRLPDLLVSAVTVPAASAGWDSDDQRHAARRARQRIQRRRLQLRKGRKQERQGRKQERQPRKQERQGRKRERQPRKRERQGRKRECQPRKQERQPRKQERQGRKEERQGRRGDDRGDNKRR